MEDARCPLTSGPLFQLQALVLDHQGLDGDVVAFPAQRWALPLAGPALAEAPDQHRTPRAVQQSDRAARALHLTVQHLLEPIPERFVLAYPAPQDDGRVANQSRNLSDGTDLLIALAILDDIDVDFEPGAL